MRNVEQVVAALWPWLDYAPPLFFPYCRLTLFSVIDVDGREHVIALSLRSKPSSPSEVEEILRGVSSRRELEEIEVATVFLQAYVPEGSGFIHFCDYVGGAEIDFRRVTYEDLFERISDEEEEEGKGISWMVEEEEEGVEFSERVFEFQIEVMP